MKQLEKYFSIKVVHETKVNGKPKHRFFDLRKCTEDDYFLFGDNQMSEQYVNGSYCPNITSDVDFELRGLYEKNVEFKSFYIQFFMCDKTQNISCGTEDDINFILNSLNWEFWMLRFYADLSNLKNYGKFPVTLGYDFIG